MAFDSYRELIHELASFPPQLSEAVANAGEPPEGEWSAAQILAHLAAIEEFWLERLNLMLNQRESLLRSFGEAATQRAEELVKDSIQENITRFSETRGQIVSALMSMTLNDWERTGTHETRGEITITDLVETIADHDAEHLEQLESYA